MMNAKEARRLTEEAMEKEIATRKERAEAFCNGLEEEIEEACNNRRNSIVVLNIPEGLYHYVISVCKDNDYIITELSNKRLQLSW